jgi:sec-independent protein translocase protein TatA
MRIGPFGHWEILVILVVVFLLFGAKRLPGAAKGVGQAIREFRRAIRGLDEDGKADATSVQAGATPSAGAAPFAAPAEPFERS